MTLVSYTRGSYAPAALASCDETSDEQLMQAYVAGDAQAFRELFRRYAPRVLRLFTCGGLSSGDGQDLLQQTFLQVHRARFDFQQGAPLRPWLFTIARNLRHEHFRRSMRRPESPLSAAGDTVDLGAQSDPTRRLESQRVRTALSSLPPAQQEVIELHWLEELPFPEVAQVVGASLSLVKVRAHRGYKALRALLGDVAPDGLESIELP